MDFSAITPALVSFLLLVTRCSGFVMSSPIWGDTLLPNTIKIGLTLALSVGLFSRCNCSHPVDPDNLNVYLALQIPLEFGIGSLLGITLTLILLPLRIAGAMLTQEIGLTLGNLTSPGMAEAPAGLGMLLYCFGALCFLGANLHHTLIAALAISFSKISASNPPWQAWCEWYAREMSTAHDLGLVVIGGMLIFLLALSVFLLFLAKASPMFNLFTVGTSIRLAAGMLGLLVFIPDIVWAIVTSMRMAAERMLFELSS